MSHKLFLLPLTVAAVVAVVVGCNSKPQPGLARGEQLYDTCVPCHGPNGEGDQNLAAPSIAGLEQWYIEEQLTKFQSGLRGWHPDDPDGHRMRPMARSLREEGDVQSVAEYVANLPGNPPEYVLTGGDPSKGEETWVTCTACHGPDARGIKDLHAPNLTDKHDWYLFSQLQKFKGGQRGAKPEDPWGLTMAAISTSLPDEQAMKDVLAYVRSLSPE